MVRAFILYYLNIKPTHGYEIQRFIQISGTDRWAKIQSGSIYYALAKLEKEKNIVVRQEERNGSRIRKIYEITEQGKQTLVKEMAEELAKPIMNVGSLKFITEPMLMSLEKEEIRRIVKVHIKQLKEQESFWSTWKEVKAGEGSNRLVQLSFSMSLQSISDQIAWHEELLNGLDEYVKESASLETMIKSFDFASFEKEGEKPISAQSLEFMQKLKAEMVKDPENAIASLDKMIEQLKKQQ